MVECSEAGPGGIVALGLVPVMLAFGDLGGKAVASSAVFCNSWARDFVAGALQAFLAPNDFYWKQSIVPCHNSSRF